MPKQEWRATNPAHNPHIQFSEKSEEERAVLRREAARDLVEKAAKMRAIHADSQIADYVDDIAAFFTSDAYRTATTTAQEKLLYLHMQKLEKIFPHYDKEFVLMVAEELEKQKRIIH